MCIVYICMYVLYVWQTCWLLYWPSVLSLLDWWSWGWQDCQTLSVSGPEMEQPAWDCGETPRGSFSLSGAELADLGYSGTDTPLRLTANRKTHGPNENIAIHLYSIDQWACVPGTMAWEFLMRTSQQYVMCMYCMCLCKALLALWVSPMSSSQLYINVYAC